MAQFSDPTAKLAIARVGRDERRSGADPAELERIVSAATARRDFALAARAREELARLRAVAFSGEADRCGG